MERTISTNELIAIELVKAWCLQPTTAGNTWDFGMVMGKYKHALKELDKMEAEEIVYDILHGEK